MSDDFDFKQELAKIFNETPHMEDPTRTELADKINDKFDEFIQKLQEELSAPPLDRFRYYLARKIAKLAGVKE